MADNFTHQGESDDAQLVIAFVTDFNILGTIKSL
jgi:hypothetical protein